MPEQTIKEEIRVQGYLAIETKAALTLQSLSTPLRKRATRQQEDSNSALASHLAKLTKKR